MSDQAEILCDRAGAGDLSAASELVGLFYERIFAYFRRRCGNDEDAADLTQKTFFKVWTSLATFQRRARFATWLHGIAHHVYVDWRRSGRPADSQTSSCSPPPNNPGNPPPAPTSLPRRRSRIKPMPSPSSVSTT